MWCQKFKVNWIQLTDKNTEFFHSIAILHRKNRVKALINGDSQWIYKKGQLWELVKDFIVLSSTRML